MAERVLDLLECLSGAPMSVREMVRLTGIPASTVHRLLRPLLARKYVLRHGWGTYGVGLAFEELLSRADMHVIVASMTRPVVNKLAKACGRTAHLGVFHDDLVRYLVKAEGRRPPPPSIEMTELEAYCTGIGKAVLSQLGPGELEEYLDTGDFVSLTPRTISDRHLLEGELASIRERGWAIDRAEFYSDLFCIAAPIPVRTGRILAAISISEYREEGDLAAVEQELLAFLPLIRDAAQEIAALLDVPVRRQSPAVACG